MPPSPPAERGRWLTRGIAGIGAASFFSDAGHEIATSLLPAFLTGTLHASAGALGLIEGISDALTGLTKLASGPFANDPTRRRRLASGGYLGTALATGAIGLATTVWQAGALRAAAWISRGLRTPARDGLLASLATPSTYGRAFGIERAGDNLGAVVGPLLASVLVSLVGVRPALYCAAIPGVFAAASIAIAAREATNHRSEVVTRSRLQLRRLRDHGLGRPLVAIGCFEMGNVAVTLLILRATQLLTHGGRTPASAASMAILIYAAHNASGALVALVGGRWIDRAGARAPIIAGALLYVAAYSAFAAPVHSWLWLLIAFMLAGAGIGLAETAGSTLVAGTLPDELRGSGFGALGAIELIGDLCSSAIVGLLYAAVSATVGFSYAAGWMVLAAVAATRLLPGR